MIRSCFDKAGKYDTAHLPGLVTSVVQGNTRTDSYYRGENRLSMVESYSPGQGARYQAYEQNGLDQLKYEYHPETGYIDYEYNAEGNLQSKTWADSTFTYTYNTANQLLSESDGTETISFIYDDHGRVREVNSSTGLWRRYDIAYNALGAVISEKQAVNGLSGDKSITYGYDANGLLEAITYPDGRSAAYVNNALLLPQSLAFNSEAGRVGGVTYGVNKQPVEYTLGNGAVFAASYDPAGRILTSGIGKGGSTLLAATYGYDEVGNIAGLTNTTPGADAGFQYDAFNRLTRATYPEKIYDYTYDPFGNLLTAQENGMSVFGKTYTGGNRIDGYGYDGRGNVTSGDGFAQGWDKRNRMVESRTVAGAMLGRYTYNERGLRVKAERSGSGSAVQVVVPNGGENLYLGAPETIGWSGTGLSGVVKLELLVNGAVVGTIAENLPATQTSYEWQVGETLEGWAAPGSDYKVRVSALEPLAAADTVYYVYDSGGRLLSEYDGAGACARDYLYLGGKMIGEYQPATSTYYYYASDQINSTRLVTDAAGNVVHSVQYDPYGGLYKTWVDTYHPKPGFSGKERESGSEMDYFGARYYGHGQYRFLSVDPIINKEETSMNPQLWNLYVYCANNPISRFDPDGKESDFGTHLFYSHNKNAEIAGEFIRNHPIASTTASIAGLAAPVAGGVAIAAGPAAWGAAFTFMAKHPNAIPSAISAISGYLISGPPDPNKAGYAGCALSIIVNWNELYGPGLKQTVSDVGSKINHLFNDTAKKITDVKNNILQFFSPKYFGPSYRGE